MSRVFHYGVIALLVLPNIVVSQLTDQQHAKIRVKIEQMIAEQHVPGFAMALVYNGFEIFDTYGVRDIEQNLPVTPDTLFVLGSNSKVFTSTLVSLYFEQMGLSLDTPINQLFPDLLVFQDRYRTEQMSMSDLLRHLYCLVSDPASGQCGVYDDVEDFIRRIRYYPVLCEFRDRFFYNSIDYSLAGHILGVITGKGYEEELKTRLLIPLGMNATLTGPEAVDKYPDIELSRSYSNNETNILPIDFSVLARTGIFTPSGSIVSSVRDMAKWMKFHLSEGRTYTGEQLLSEAAMRRIQTAQVLSVTDGEAFEPAATLNLHYAYGLGLSVGTHKGYRHLQHGGAYIVYQSDFALFPDLDLGIFTITNGPAADEFHAQYDIHNYILDVILEEDEPVMQLPHKPPNVWKSGVASSYGTTNIGDSKASVNNSIYMGTYGSYAFGNMTVFETETQELRLIFGNYCTGSMRHIIGDTFFFHYDDPTYGYDLFNLPVPMAFNVTAGGVAESILLELPEKYYRLTFQRDVNMSNAPEKLWEDSSCS